MRSIVAAAVAVAAALAGAAPVVAQDAPPRVVMLSPAWAAAVNPATVEVAALVRGPGAVLSLDGRVVRRVRTSCPEQVVSATVPAAQLAEGTHLAVVSVGARRAGHGFRVDRGAARPDRNRIEAAATPAHLACLSRTELRLQPGRTLDLARDRVVLETRGRVVARTARDFGLRRVGPGRYAFPRVAGAFTLRVGDDWGALDARGRRVTRSTPPADPARAATAEIGAAGGQVTATDANGVRIALDVPPGALDRAVRMTLAPLAGPALAASFSQPGLRLEPHGLVFARPAQLTLDYSATEHRVEPGERVQLVTSPLTALPLPGSASPSRGRVVGFLSHFSETVAGVTREQYTELKSWADPVLSSTDAITFGELELLLGFTNVQQQTGACAGDACVGLAAVGAQVDAAVSTLAEARCAADVADPDRTFVRRWLLAEAAVQILGGASGVAGDCARRIVDALVVRAQGNVDALTDAAEAAEETGDTQLANYVRDRARDHVRARLNAARARCGLDGGARSQLLALAPDAAIVDDPALQGELQAAVSGCGDPPTGGTPTGAPAPSPAGDHAPSGAATPPGGAATPPPGPTGFVPPAGVVRSWTALEEGEGGVPMAPECEPDTLDPTLQAAADWHATLEAVPDGTDASPVRQCLEEVVRALVDDAIAGANAAQTIATLQALADAEQAATLWGLASEADRAGDGLVDAVRLVAENGSSTCAADADAGRDLLLFALAWAPTVAPRDPELAAHVDGQLDGCEDDALLRVLSGGRGPIWEVVSLCSRENVAVEGRRAALLPTTVATGSGPSHIGMTLAQPTATRITVDVTLQQIATGVGGGDLTGLWCRAALVVISSVAGTLHAAFEPAVGGTQLGGAYEAIPGIAQPSAGAVHFDPGEPAVPIPPVHVNAGAVALVAVQVTPLTCGAFPGCAPPFAYAGRLATIDFVPDP